MYPSFIASCRQRFSPRPCVDSLRIVWTDGGRSLEPAQATFQVPLQPIRASHGEVDERIQWIKLEPSLGEAACLVGLSGNVVRVPHESSLKVDERQAGVSTRE